MRSIEERPFFENKNSSQMPVDSINFKIRYQTISNFSTSTKILVPLNRSNWTYCSKFMIQPKCKKERPVLPAEFHHVFCDSVQIACNKCLRYAAFVERLKKPKKTLFYCMFVKLLKNYNKTVDFPKIWFLYYLGIRFGNIWDI